MGLLRRLLGRDDPGGTDAFGRPLQGQAPTAPTAAPAAPASTPPAERSPAPVWVKGIPLPPDLAQAVESALAELDGAGGIDAAETVDLGAIPGLQGELVQVLGLHAHDGAAMRRAAVEVLRRRGVRIPLPRPQPSAERLRALGELRDRGVLTDAEFEEQRRRALGEL